MDWIQIAGGFAGSDGICVVLPFERETGFLYGPGRRYRLDHLFGGGADSSFLWDSIPDFRNCSGFIYGNYGNIHKDAENRLHCGGYHSADSGSCPVSHHVLLFSGRDRERTGVSGGGTGDIGGYRGRTAFCHGFMETFKTKRSRKKQRRRRKQQKTNV